MDFPRTAAQVYADGPIGSPLQPEKSEIRPLLKQYEDAIAAFSISVNAAVVKGTKAELDAVLGSFAQGDVGLVITDPTEALRGVYKKGSASWEKQSDLPSDVAQAAAAQAAASETSAAQSKAAAEAARDQAAGYVNDIAIEKEVPIYGTVAGMPFLAVDAGINIIQILGRNALLDNEGVMTWGRVASQPDVAPAQRFRSTDRYLPNGSLDAANGGWWQYKSTRPKLDQFTGAFSVQSRLEVIQARMANGESVKVACFGDSQTDGMATSGWTANPIDGSGNAVGAGDHSGTAPNAWPAKAQALLRLIHGNNNITFFNAGYSGKQIADGWAYGNYERAVINNPAYGVADIVTIMFGPNDVGAGATLATFIQRHRDLALKVMAYGSIPVFISSDVAGTNGGVVNTKLSRQFDAAKKALAADLGVPFIDFSGAERLWLGSNEEGFTWLTEQFDLLHFQDYGHTFKACYFLKELFYDAVEVKQGERHRITQFDSRVKATFDQLVRTTNTLSGGTVVFRNGFYTLGGTISEMWVWNENPNAELIYRGIGDEGYTAASFSTAMKIDIYHPITGQTQERKPAGQSFNIGSSPYQRSDLPYRVGRLPFGLSRVRIIANTVSGQQQWMGNFEIWSTPRTIINDALKNVGYMQRFFPTGAPPTQVEFIPEFSDGSNVFGLMDTEAVEIIIDATLPDDSGIILAHCAGYGDSGFGTRTFLAVYRTSTNLAFYFGTKRADGTVALQSSGLTGAHGYGTSRAPMRAKWYRTATQQRIELWNGMDTGSQIINGTVNTGNYALPFAGAVGGLLWNNAGGGTAVIHKMIVNKL